MQNYHGQLKQLQSGFHFDRLNFSFEQQPKHIAVLPVASASPQSPDENTWLSWEQRLKTSYQGITFGGPEEKPPLPGTLPMSPSCLSELQREVPSSIDFS